MSTPTHTDKELQDICWTMNEALMYLSWELPEKGDDDRPWVDKITNAKRICADLQAAVDEIAEKYNLR